MYNVTSDLSRSSFCGFQHALSVSPVKAGDAGSSRKARSVSDSEDDDRGFDTFNEKMRSEFRDGTLSPAGRKLAGGVLAPGKQPGLGTRVSTFAVDGLQASDIVVIKRVPPVDGQTNIVVYVPQEDGNSFHEFKDSAQMAAWVKGIARDPDQLDTFSQHFADAANPGQLGRVKNTMTRFAEGDRNAVVGSYGYERRSIFERMEKGRNDPPVPVNGLINVRLYKVDGKGDPTFIGTRKDGNEVLYKYDAYGNLHGGSKDGFYFVKNGLNNNEPLELMSFSKYRQTVSSVSLDNVGANDIRGLYEELIKQLRSPGHGLGTALHALGVPEDIAHSIEKIIKNPVSGTLLELNQGNRIGNLFGVEKEEMDTALGLIGHELQSRIKYYGTIRQGLDELADAVEPVLPKEGETVIR